MSKTLRVLALLGAALIVTVYAVSIVSAFYVPPDTPASDNNNNQASDNNNNQASDNNNNQASDNSNEINDDSPEIWDDSPYGISGSNNQPSNVQSGANVVVGIAAPEKQAAAPPVTEEQGLGTSLLGFPPLLAIAKMLLKTPAAALPYLVGGILTAAAIIAAVSALRKFGLPTFFPKKSEEQLKKEAIQREEQKLLREIRGPKK